MTCLKASFTFSKLTADFRLKNTEVVSADLTQINNGLDALAGEPLAGQAVEKIATLEGTKQSIRQAIADAGVSPVSEVMSELPANIANIGQENQWFRPSFWPDIPDIPIGVQRLYMLFAVFPNANRMSFRMLGNYNVKLWDGETLLTNEDVTSNTDFVSIIDSESITSPITPRGYKTVLVEVNPQEGSNLTHIYLTAFNGLPSNATSNWLDFDGRLPEFTTLGLSSSSYFPNPRMLERVKFRGPHKMVSIGFTNCENLEMVDIEQHGIVGGSNMFNSIGVRNLPAWDWSLIGGSWAYFCPGSKNLKVIPDLDIPLVDSIQQAFSQSPVMVPSVIVCGNISAPNSISSQNLFNTQSSLLYVGSLNTGSGRFDRYFASCKNLQHVESVEMGGGVTNTNLMFSGCASLRHVRLPNLGMSLSLASTQLPYSILKLIIEEDLTPLTAPDTATLTITGTPDAAQIMSDIAASVITVPSGWTISN